MSFYILADNCSDLPASRNTTCKDFQILNLSFFLDNAPGDPTIRSADFYNKLRAGSMSRTSQINPPEFEDVFRRIIAQGYHEILYLAFSSGLSGTYHSSTVAAQNIMKENPNVRILTVDTLAAALGEGLIVDKAVEVRDQGKTIDEVAQWVEENKLKTAHWFTVDDLNFLKRGGRISASAAWFGSALKIKPVLHVDNNGKLIPMEKKPSRPVRPPTSTTTSPGSGACRTTALIRPVELSFGRSGEEDEQPCSVRAIFIYCFFRAYDISKRFAHLFAVLVYHALREKILKRFLIPDQLYVAKSHLER